MALSPMMQQYFDMKTKYGKYILFYRVGDFYEMFFDDAETASRELDLVLTGKDCGLEQRAPMCGVPYHSCDGYIARLIAKGYKVAICEQTEDPAAAKGLVKRDVIRIVTPGTLTEPEMLAEGKNNYLASLCLRGKSSGLAFVDVSTGAIYATQTQCGISEIMGELARFAPSEIVMDPAAAQNLVNAVTNGCAASIETGCEEDYAPAAVADRLMKALGYVCVGGEKEPAETALSAALGYIDDVYKGSVKFGRRIEWYSADRFMNIDATARRNLELEKSLRGDRKGSLLSVLDRTATPMGKRLLAEFLQRPLLDCAAVSRRQNAVAELVGDDITCSRICECLGRIRDIERIITRVCYGSANARELRGLADALEGLPELKTLLAGAKSSLLREIFDTLDPLEDLRELINSAIVDEPPLAVTEGGVIRRGWNAEADRLSELLNNSHAALAAVEAEERENSGIKQLKVGYNRVFGYYIEITRSNTQPVPDYFIRKQTLTTGERYITPRLKELENDILQGRGRLTALEYELFADLRRKVAATENRVRATASAIANLDVFASLATVALRNNYCRPDVDAGDSIEITDGRHPVVEQSLTSGGFVPNNTLLDRGENKILIITGPNMAGKSTYMRQNALIVIMAQIGSFVPASSAHIGVADAIFTRVGASDDLAGGQSTFMVEMSELAYILKNATAKSLIILDEIGRGTSTFDGMSIAGAVVEYIADNKKIGAKTLFATHYHELCKMEDRLDCVKNYNVLVKKRGDEITFLRRIARGGADDSYGIEVSKLAGVPEGVIRRAKALLAELEADRENRVYAEKERRVSYAEGEQAAFTDDRLAALVQKLKNTDVNSLTPLDALTELSALVESAGQL